MMSYGCLWFLILQSEPHARSSFRLLTYNGSGTATLSIQKKNHLVAFGCNHILVLLADLVHQACVYLTGRAEIKSSEANRNDFLRLETIRCHRELKLDQPLTSIPLNNWNKTWHLYSEFSTRGLIVELRQIGSSSGCLKKNVRSTVVTFLWNDLLSAPCLTVQKEVGKEVRAVALITPPAQAPYLLKYVPDRVTDNSGAMISEEILKLNWYRPQEGRRLSHTVLDHNGKECFVVRVRVDGGIWRRGGENPVAVKWEDRIIEEVREGNWNYVAGSIGIAPVFGSIHLVLDVFCWYRTPELPS